MHSRHERPCHYRVDCRAGGVPTDGPRQCHCGRHSDSDFDGHAAADRGSVFLDTARPDLAARAAWQSNYLRTHVAISSSNVADSDKACGQAREAVPLVASHIPDGELGVPS